MDIASEIIRDGYPSDEEIAYAFNEYFFGRSTVVPVIRFGRLGNAAARMLQTSLQTMRDHNLCRDKYSATDYIINGSFNYANEGVLNLLPCISEVAVNHAVPGTRAAEKGALFVHRNPECLKYGRLLSSCVPHIDRKSQDYLPFKPGKVTTCSIGLFVVSHGQGTCISDIDVRRPEARKVGVLLEQLRFAATGKRLPGVSRFAIAQELFSGFKEQCDLLGAGVTASGPLDVMLTAGNAVHWTPGLEDPAGVEALPERVVFTQQWRWRGFIC